MGFRKSLTGCTIGLSLNTRLKDTSWLRRSHPQKSMSNAESFWVSDLVCKANGETHEIKWNIFGRASLSPYSFHGTPKRIIHLLWNPWYTFTSYVDASRPLDRWQSWGENGKLGARRTESRRSWIYKSDKALKGDQLLLVWLFFLWPCSKEIYGQVPYCNSWPIPRKLCCSLLPSIHHVITGQGQEYHSNPTYSTESKDESKGYLIWGVEWDRQINKASTDSIFLLLLLFGWFGLTGFYAWISANIVL